MANKTTSNPKRDLLAEVLKVSAEAVLDHLDRVGFFVDESRPALDLNLRKLGSTIKITNAKKRKTVVKGRKLTAKEARDIYNDNRTSYQSLSRVFGISESAISQIKNGVIWSSATGHKNNRQQRAAK